MGVYIKMFVGAYNCLDCTIETQAVYHRQSMAMNTCTCCCRVGKCTLLTIMQISDRVSAIFGGINIGYRYMPKTHIGTPLQVATEFKKNYLTEFLVTD